MLFASCSLVLNLWSVGTYLYTIPDQGCDLLYILNLCSLPKHYTTIVGYINTGTSAIFVQDIYLSCLVIGSWPPAAPVPQQSKYIHNYTWRCAGYLYMCNIYITRAPTILYCFGCDRIVRRLIVNCASNSSPVIEVVTYWALVGMQVNL